MPGPDAHALFAELSGPVFRYLLRMTGAPARAEELTQDTFVRIVRALPDYEARGRDRAWVFGIARNVLLNERRRGARKPAPAEIDDARIEGTRADASERVALIQALASLTEADRDVFLLRELGGLDYAEIASLAAMSPAAVRNRLYRARVQLRRALRPAVVDEQESNP